MYHTSLRENSSVQQLYSSRSKASQGKVLGEPALVLPIILFHSINTWTDEVQSSPWSQVQLTWFHFFDMQPLAGLFTQTHWFICCCWRFNDRRPGVPRLTISKLEDVTVSRTSFLLWWMSGLMFGCDKGHGKQRAAGFPPCVMLVWYPDLGHLFPVTIQFRGNVELISLDPKRPIWVGSLSARYKGSSVYPKLGMKLCEHVCPHLTIILKLEWLH